jgi:hypothetical protein
MKRLFSSLKASLQILFGALVLFAPVLAIQFLPELGEAYLPDFVADGLGWLIGVASTGLLILFGVYIGAIWKWEAGGSPRPAPEDDLSRYNRECEERRQLGGQAHPASKDFPVHYRN